MLGRSYTYVGVQPNAARDAKSNKQLLVHIMSSRAGVGLCLVVCQEVDVFI